ncbi:MAG: Ni/Fe hydrogenase subunit alpha, partial [Gemmataceae bacterium]
LSGPDLVLGWDCPPEKRNVFGLIENQPELARAGIRLRQFGQDVIESLGGRKIHPAWTVPGGVREPLSAEARDGLKKRLPEALSTIKLALELSKKTLDQYKEEVLSYGNFPSLFLGLVQADGTWEHYDGKLRFVDSSGVIVAELTDMLRYQDLIGECVEHDSFLKSPYFKPLGFPSGVYRVGPLARLNICTQMGTPLADIELAEFRQRGGRVVNASFFYHHARLIEILSALERLEVILDDPDLLSPRVRAQAGINNRESVGVSEAPRGTLFHHYKIDENGLMQKVNFIIATGQNNLAMNQTVTQIAKHYIKSRDIPETMLNRVEAGIRAFDPCLSCSTHAAGQMPLVIELLSADGAILDKIQR